MFTGLIEEVGTLVALQPAPGGAALRLRAPGLAPELAPGDSLAVNGLCLTVERLAGDLLEFHLGEESLARTTARSWRPGRPLNLERALAAGARLGGHFVTGHVDDIGAVTAVRPAGGTIWLALSYPPSGAPFLVEKGSLAVDGVSLTVARLAEAELQIQIIPFTWEHTALARLRPGDEVNLEYDLLGKYVVRYLEHRAGGPPSGITEQFLRDHGFA